MATCKDCIHYEACKKHGHLMFTANNLYELMYQNGVEHSCTTFKNKADFVEVKHGEWKCINNQHNYYEYHCSLCGRVERQKEPYCHCGAKMDGTPKERGGEK